MNRKLLFIITVLALMVLLLKPVFSQDANDYFNQGNSMLVAGKFEKAVHLYNSAISQNPDYAEAYIGLGMAYKESGKYEESYEATMQALKIKPGYYQAYYNLGLVLEKQNRKREAINAYDKFLDEVPGAERFSDAKQRIARLKKSL